MKPGTFNPLRFSSALLVLPFLVGCGEPATAPAPTPAPEPAVEMPKPVVSAALTAEEQAALTPDVIIQQFKDGNARFLANDLTVRDHTAKVRSAATGQFPKAVVLSCLDSRIPVEDVFDLGLGDVFVGRVAGNIVNEDLLGSMEFGTKVMGSKVILVLGHKHCGAVVSAIDNVQLGNITAMLSKIQPAVKKSQDFQGEKLTSNVAFVDHVSKNNVLHVTETIMAQSPIIAELVKNGTVKIVGAYYDMETGAVEFLN
jgi:carbonic anhydrase